jgi:hypothetical protein
MWPKCGKCGGGHRAKNYGIRCSFCNGLGHLEDCCWKKKVIKPSNTTTNYLEVLVDDEEATLTKLNRICDVNHHLSYRNMIPKRRLLMQVNEAEGIIKQVEGVKARDRTREVMFDFGARSKKKLHFMKGWIFLTPMETIMRILKELEYLEGLVKLARRNKDEDTSRNQLTTVNNTPVVKRISVNKTY